MSSKEKINISKKLFKTPEGYFKDISLSTLFLPKRERFKVPKNYFENFKLDSIKQNIKPKGYLNLIINEFKYSGVAAVFIIGLFINVFFNEPSEISDEEIIKYLDSDLVDFTSSDFSELIDSEDFELNTQNLNENYLEYYVETSFSTEEILIID